MTSNEDQIRRWFAERADMNYAVVCDPWHVILDPDEGYSKKGVKKEGIANFLAAEQDASDGFVDDSIFDHTFRVRTPKGGVHLYFTAEGAYANSASTIIPDVDVRGPDGYVVGPGSYTMDDPDHNTVEGEYVIEVAEDPAELPAWLKAKLEQGGHVGERAKNANTAAMLIDTPASIETAKRVLRERRVAMEGQGGDEHTYVTACLVKDYGVSRDMCFELMFATPLFEGGKTWNDMCDPPWDSEGLATKVANAYRYGNNQIGRKMDALSAFGEIGTGGEASSDDAMAAMQAKLGAGEHISAIDQPIGTDDSAQRIHDMIHPSNDFVKRDVNVESLIPGWIPAFGVTAILAKRGTGKTVVINDIAHHIACDLPWNGIDIDKDWAVIYLCGEDDIGLQRQMKAWRKAHGISPAEDRFLVATGVPNLMDAREVQLWADELKARFKGRRVLVVLDTWQRATSTASQNDDKEMQKAVHHAEALARVLDGCALIAFHPPKGNEETITGSMVIENSTVCIMNIFQATGNKKLQVKRIKGKGEGNYAMFKIIEVELDGYEKDGTPITGVIPKIEGSNRSGPEQDRTAELENVRKLCMSHFGGTLIRRGEASKGVKSLSMNDAAEILLSYITVAPNSEEARFFGNPSKTDELLPLMRTLFNPGCELFFTHDGTMFEAQVRDGKFWLL